MGTILESTKELAKRFGVENEEQTIKDQIDAITETIDANFNGSVDIASAVSEFAKNDNPDARLGTKLITENNTYVALDDELDGYSSVIVEVPSAPTPETFEVNISTDVSTDPPISKTYSEIKAAIDSNKKIIGSISGEGIPGDVNITGADIIDLKVPGEEPFIDAIIIYGSASDLTIEGTTFTTVLSFALASDNSFFIAFPNFMRF